MDIPAKIQFAAERLHEGHRINRITVRDFLGHFSAERRGSNKVQEIRSVLDSLELTTEPDFETAWIDAPIWLRLKPGVPIAVPTPHKGHEAEMDSGLEEMILEGNPAAVRQAEEQSQTAPTSTEPEVVKNPEQANPPAWEDPTFRIGSLPAANRKLVVVNQSDPVMKAITLMLQHDYSQLPVMQGEREVKGMITWKSIASKNALGGTAHYVKDCREEAKIVDSNRTLFDAIPVIVDSGYVLVRDASDRRITGIVTASDLSVQFRILSEPFLTLREIELHVRQLLGPKLCGSDFSILAAAPPKADYKPQCIADLSFGEYVRLLQHPNIWEKLGLKIDRTTLIDLMEQVRTIRNDVMHFDSDPMTGDELTTLNSAARFLRNLHELMI